MLSPAASRLYSAVKRCLVNRNTAINILEQPNSRNLIIGAFVRVLIQMPSEQQEYILARIASLEVGEPYGGFAPDVSRQCNWYLILELPAQLANINGVCYQLNSVSNGELSEREFVLWGTLAYERNNNNNNNNNTAAVGSYNLPSISELEEIGNRIQPYYVPNFRSAVNNNGNINNNNNRNRNQSVALNMNYQVNVAPTSSTYINSPENATHHAIAYNDNNNNNSNNNNFNQHDIRQNTFQNINSPQPAFTQTNRVSGGTNLANGNVLMNDTNNHNVANFVANRITSNDINQHANNNTETVNRVRVEYNRNREGVPLVELDSRPLIANTSLPDANHTNRIINNNNNNNSVSVTPSGPAAQAFWRDAASRVAESAEEEEDRLDREEIMAKFREGHVLFPKEFINIKLNILQMIEKDLNDYLQLVREALSNKRETCVICACREPTVILLPCKHKVACRLCAPRWNSCPVCRSEVKEMFEVAQS